MCKAASQEVHLKVVIITGGSRGIGASTARLCARRGMGVILTYNSNPEAAEEVVTAIEAEGGHIVNISSATARVATAGVAPYASFKGGLEVLTRYMAKEFGERGIRANSIAPGAIRTELGGGLNDDFEALLASQTALGRVGEPDDVGGAIASLPSDESCWINAQSIEVAGGYVI